MMDNSTAGPLEKRKGDTKAGKKVPVMAVQMVVQMDLLMAAMSVPKSVERMADLKDSLTELPMVVLLGHETVVAMGERMAHKRVACLVGKMDTLSAQKKVYHLAETMGCLWVVYWGLRMVLQRAEESAAQ